MRHDSMALVGYLCVTPAASLAPHFLQTSSAPLTRRSTSRDSRDVILAFTPGLGKLSIYASGGRDTLTFVAHVIE